MSGSPFDPVVTWKPTASYKRLRQRAEMLAAIRAFFSFRGVMEVETPGFSAFPATNPCLNPFRVRDIRNTGPVLYAHTSPEYAMKRLLAAGIGPVYQICHVWRAGECGRWHNPEFTMLEWYRPGYDEYRLMAEVEDLVRHVIHENIGSAEYISYQRAFMDYAGINPFTASVETLMKSLPEGGMPDLAERSEWLDLVFSIRVAPQLGKNGLAFLTRFPPQQAELARLSSDALYARRFELFFRGMELANGYYELTDSIQCQQRMQSDAMERRRRKLPELSVDTRLLAAMEHGLPVASGVALGIDRLAMVVTGTDHIREVLTFPGELA